MIDIDDYFGGLTEEEYVEQTEEHFKELSKLMGSDLLATGTKFIKQHPYIGEDGIYIPCSEYIEEGCGTNYKCILTKEMFIEAYNKWIKE